MSGAETKEANWLVEFVSNSTRGFAAQIAKVEVVPHALPPGLTSSLSVTLRLLVSDAKTINTEGVLQDSTRRRKVC